MIKWNLSILYLLLLLLSCSCIACRNAVVPGQENSAGPNEISITASSLEKIHALKKLTQSGDLITRTGNDFTSQSLKSLNRRNKTFSHCGIIKIENDSVFVYHTLGGEWNPDQKLRKDPFEIFADPASNNLLGLFRYNIPTQDIERMLALGDSLYKAETPFDMDFSLLTTDRMYCAEFVYYCLQGASNKPLAVNKSKINDFIFVGVDDLFLLEECTPVGVIKFR